MIDVFIALKKSGQTMSKDLANKLKISQRTLAVELYPHIAAGRVMSCLVKDGRGKLLGTQYRISGVIPETRPGPKPGATK